MNSWAPSANIRPHFHKRHHFPANMYSVTEYVLQEASDVCLMCVLPVQQFLLFPSLSFQYERWVWFRRWAGGGSRYSIDIVVIIDWSIQSLDTHNRHKWWLLHFPQCNSAASSLCGHLQYNMQPLCLRAKLYKKIWWVTVSTQDVKSPFKSLSLTIIVFSSFRLIRVSLCSYLFFFSRRSGALQVRTCQACSCVPSHRSARDRCGSKDTKSSTWHFIRVVFYL